MDDDPVLSRVTNFGTEGSLARLPGARHLPQRLIPQPGCEAAAGGSERSRGFDDPPGTPDLRFVNGLEPRQEG